MDAVEIDYVTTEVHHRQRRRRTAPTHPLSFGTEGKETGALRTAHGEDSGASGAVCTASSPGVGGGTCTLACRARGRRTDCRCEGEGWPAENTHGGIRGTLFSPLLEAPDSRGLALRFAAVLACPRCFFPSWRRRRRGARGVDGVRSLGGMSALLLARPVCPVEDAPQHKARSRSFSKDRDVARDVVRGQCCSSGLAGIGLFEVAVRVWSRVAARGEVVVEVLLEAGELGGHVSESEVLG